MKEAWLAEPGELRASGLRQSAIQETLKARKSLHIEEEIASLERKQIGWITIMDTEYPVLLKKIANPPLVLYWKGKRPCWPEFALAIVGTRKASRDGLQIAGEFASTIADMGYTIISGLAQGIDAAAHEAALSSRGGTTAVLGSGLEEIYPSRNRHLAERVTDSGMVISEFAPKVKPSPGNFPYRNRIISGLSLGVLVIEAPSRSGALNTVKHATEQGREVFAVPHSIYSQMGQGCNDLLADGACIARNANDVLNVLRGNPLTMVGNQNITEEISANSEKPDENIDTIPPQLFSETEETILHQMETTPQHVDEIAENTGLDTAAVSSTLTLLEIKGQVELVGAMLYRKVSGLGGH